MSQAAPVPASNKYDEVPYTSRAFMTTHPEHLATRAMIFGMNPTPLSRARVLEIGSAAGGNILPVACANPGATFIGIDYSKVMIHDLNGRPTAIVNEGRPIPELSRA